MKSRLKQLIYFSALLVFMGSCGIYNRYSRPQVDADGLYRRDGVPADTVSSLASLPWEQLFTDTCLQDLIREGLASNTDLNVARLKVKEAQASLLSSKLAYLPSLQLDPQGSLSSFDGSKPAKTYNLGASASWEVDVFGKLTNAKRSAKAYQEQSDAYRQAVQTQLVATIAESYYSLLMLDEQVEISTQTVESWKEYVRSLRGLMKAGSADRSDLNQAEASRLETEASLLDLKQQVSELENSLSVLLGRVPGTIVRGQLSDQQFPDQLSVGVPLDLLSRRPDVRQAESALEQAFYTTNQARAAFYPSITLSGSAGWTNSGGAAITNPGAWLLQAVGSLVQPLFNKGKNIANLQIAKAQQEEALLNFRQALLDAGSEVNNALMQWQTSRDKAGLDRRQVEHLATVVHDTGLLMEHGTVNYLQVLSARQSLLAARINLVADRYGEIQGVISLYHALGGGAD